MHMMKGVFFDFGDTLAIEKEGKSLRTSTPETIKGVKSTLRELKRRKLKLVIVSNTYTSDRVELKGAMKRMGIDRFFEEVITSVDIGFSKPHKRIFRVALEAVKLKPSEVVMVGNRIEKDVVGGNKMGMTTVWFHWNERYESNIRNESQRPDFVISSFKDLLEVMDQLRPPRAKSLAALAREVRSCTKCPLHKTRKNAVPGEGSSKPRVLFVGEAPGKKEDELGRPFAGMAGRILDGALEEVGMERRNVFITSVLRCRPPKNRNPRKSETDSCRPYLSANIELLKPRVIVAMGNYALKGLTGSDHTMSKARGKQFEFDGIPIIPTYHPAACLYNRKLKKLLIADLERISEF
jgi:DNA polymerase